MQSDNDVKDDTRLDTLSEPSAPLITENVALPDVIFKSHFLYLLYEMAHYTKVVICSMIPVVLILLSLPFHDPAVYTIAFLLCGFDVLFLAGALSSFNNPLPSNRAFQTKLLLEAITCKPAVLSEEWRTIAYNMNQYLFDQGLWNTPYYFYCGRTCHRFLLKLLVGKSFDVLSLSSTSPIMEAQLEVPTTGSSNEENGTFTFSPGPDFRMCLYKAAVIEQQAQRDYWRKQYPNTGLI
ncbi:hypothetical protein SEUBUCD646_0F00410 [Saccharomyces eubayanus]|nr:hypothetical protein SEUBUCD646_0F00410 [Saccharomyces eubayanus]